MEIEVVYKSIIRKIEGRAVIRHSSWATSGKRLGVESNHPHYVCNDALTYDYSFGKPVGLEAFYE